MPEFTEQVKVDGRRRTLRADPAREYVAAGSRLSLVRGIRTLPWAIDDLAADFGDDIYDRMMLDPQVVANVNIYKAFIISDGIRLVPAVEDEDDQRHPQAVEIAKWCLRVLNALDPSIDDVMWDMLDALPYGNRVAEEVWEVRGGQLVLKALKVKPRRAVAFVVDEYMNLVGLVAGGGRGRSGRAIITTEDGTSQILPRSKFAVLSFRPKNGDPRGTTLLRPAYTPWWIKQQAHPIKLKYLAQFGSASIIGKTAPNAPDGYAKDADGNDIPGSYKTAIQWLLDALLEFQAGSALAVPNGTEVDTIEVRGGGEAFLAIEGQSNREITKAILHQVLATEEAEFGTRAQATVHQDVLGIILRQTRKAVARMIHRDILEDLVRYNYGDEAAANLTPTVDLGEVEQQDMIALMNAVANLERAGFLADEQRPAIDVKLGLPVRSTADASRGERADDEARESDT